MNGTSVGNSDSSEGRVEDIYAYRKSDFLSPPHITFQMVGKTDIFFEYDWIHYF